MPIFLAPDSAEIVQSTLAEIERELAPRLGPYRRLTASAGSTSEVALVGRLASSLSLGGLEDLYLLRRGKMAADGSAISGFNADDRQRIVVNRLEDGGLELDRPYTNPPVEGEDLELHYLDPQDELRPTVLAGLRRARIVDRSPVTFTDAGAEHDVTALAPWIRQTTQVYELHYSYAGNFTVPALVRWWRAFLEGGHVWVAASPDPFPQDVLVTSWRYAATLVNGAYSAQGPTDDDDLVNIPVRYAAAAAHIEGFRYGNVRARVIEAGRTGLFIDQKMAAEAFEQEAADHFHPPSKRDMLTEPFGLSASVLLNAPGPRD